MKIQLRNKLLLLTISMTLVSILIISLIFSFEVKERSERKFLKDNHNKLKLINKAINLFFYAAAEDVTYLSKHPLLRKADVSITSYMQFDHEAYMSSSSNGGIEQKIYTFFSKFMQDHSFRYVYLGTEQGGLVQYPEGMIMKNFDPRVRFWYRKAKLHPGKVIMTKAYYFQPDNAINVILARTVTNNNGKIIGVLGVDISLDHLTSMIRSFEMGNTGYAILMQQDGTILANPADSQTNFKNIRDTKIQGTTPTQSLASGHHNQEWQIGPKKYIASFYPAQWSSPNNYVGAEWILIGVIEKEEFWSDIYPMIRIIVFIAFALILSVIILSLFVSKKITSPLEDLMATSQQVIAGNYQVRSNIQTNDELKVLGETFNHMIEKIQNNIKLLDQRVDQRTHELSHLHKKQKHLIEQMEGELSMAQELQSRFIPQSHPQLTSARFHSIYQPMREIGGDLYDFITLDYGNKTGIFISDVSGHGVPAALITSMVKSLLTTARWNNVFPSSMLSYINRHLYGQTRGNFLTAFYAIYDEPSKTLEYARAGHNYPWLIRYGEIIELKGKGKMLGILEEIEFEEKQLILEPGDILLFYTDGLTEAINKKGEMFENQLRRLVLEYDQEGIHKLLEKIYRELVAFVQGDQFEDDVCFVGMEIL